ncbi:AAA-type ATPase family protein [Prunus dulcis]|nr:AAA-type ATPase family protein [Prunus dulcis]
MGAELQN